MDFGSGKRQSVMGPWRGVIWVAALAGALVVVMYGMKGVGLKKGADPGAKPLTNANATTAPAGATTAPAKATTAPARARAGNGILAVLEPEPQGMGAREIPKYLTDPETLTRDEGSAAIGTFPFFYLLYQAEIGDQAKVADAAVPAPGLEKMAAWEPGKAVSLEGTITSKQARVDLAIPEARMASTMQYRMTDASGSQYLVFTARSMAGVARRDTVNVVGRFLRLYDDPEAARTAEGAAKPTPVIVAQQVDGSRYLNDPSCLDAVRDKSLGTLSKPFFYLLNRVNEMSQAELVAKADATLTPEALTRSPKRARGKPVAIDGNIIMMPQEWGETPNIAGTGRLYMTIILTSKRTPVWVYTLEEPKGFLEGDLLRANGLFMQVRSYSKKGFERTALIVLARRLTPVEVEESHGLAMTVAIGGVIVVILLIICTSIDRRSGRKFNRHVHSLAAKSRPKDIDASAKAAAARIRESRKAPGGASSPDDESPDADADESD